VKLLTCNMPTLQSSRPAEDLDVIFEIEILPHLNNVVPGCILLGGLVIYDVVWVFGTDVMVTSITSPFLRTYNNRLLIS